jgi:hypothetical protein
VPASGQALYWITGGLYMYTTNLKDILIQDNVFSENKGFQIGYSELFLSQGRSWDAVAGDQMIRVTGNLFDGPNSIDIPIRSGGMPIDQVLIYATNGQMSRFENPKFEDPPAQNFSRPGTVSDFWWKTDFPPHITANK